MYWIRDKYGHNRLKYRIHWHRPVFTNPSTGHAVNIFEAWCHGLTGFPIVDAGMRQLKETGFMHFRSRLIAANFLVRMLGISWEMGQQV